MVTEILDIAAYKLVSLLQRMFRIFYKTVNGIDFLHVIIITPQKGQFLSLQQLSLNTFGTFRLSTFDIVQCILFYFLKFPASLLNI